MKMKMLLASGLCFALSCQIFAQEITPSDSVYITPFAGCKIVLVGKGINNLLKKNGLEVLKNKFIEDYRESTKDKDFPAEAKNIIYLASQDGRRRLKATPDEDIPLNIENEIKAFKIGLPSFHYTIYDLTKAFEYHLYVNEPGDLEKLASIDCTRLLAEVAGTEVPKFKKYVSIEIGPSDGGFVIKKQRRNLMDIMSLNGFMGASLINNRLSPTIGYNLEYIKTNKYSKPNFKLGFSQSIYILADFENKKFTNFYRMASSNIHFLKNISHSNRELWFGLSAGRFYNSKLPDSSQTGTLHKAFKWGITTEFNSMGLEFNFIVDKQKNKNAAITFKYYF